MFNHIFPKEQVDNIVKFVKTRRSFKGLVCYNLELEKYKIEVIPGIKLLIDMEDNEKEHFVNEVANLILDAIFSAFVVIGFKDDNQDLFINEFKLNLEDSVVDNFLSTSIEIDYPYLTNVIKRIKEVETFKVLSNFIESKINGRFEIYNEVIKESLIVDADYDNRFLYILLVGEINWSE